MSLLQVKVARSDTGADPTGLTQAHLAQLRAGTGAILILIHGYKYDARTPRHCPHDRLFQRKGWADGLGLDTPGGPDGISFCWPARGTLPNVAARARTHGRQLAQMIALLRDHAPHRPLRLISHSMGSEVLLSTLAHSTPHAVDRAVMLMGASYRSYAQQVLRQGAGAECAVLNVVSRENDLFDLLLEQLVQRPSRQDRTIGCGIEAANTLTLQLDCAATLSALAGHGVRIAPGARRICHGSGYKRPGALAFYARFLTCDDLPLPLLRRIVPPHTTGRWSRLRIGKGGKNGMMAETATAQDVIA